jgi:outer membrane lipoprotein carrier protein
MSILFAVLLTTLQAAPSNLIDGLDRTFARMKDFSADFVQTEKDSLNRNRQQSGHLYLMKPRKMRWEYKTPEETYFISDGKMVYFYVPADKQVQQDQVRDTLDDRIPLMFLVGRENLRGEFTRFEIGGKAPAISGMTVVKMYPKRKTDISEVLMEVDASNYQIRRLVLTHTDGSSMEFIFSNIQTNKGLKEALFDFKVPPGVKVLEGIGQ